METTTIEFTPAKSTECPTCEGQWERLTCGHYGTCDCATISCPDCEEGKITDPTTETWCSDCGEDYELQELFEYELTKQDRPCMTLNLCKACISNRHGVCCVCGEKIQQPAPHCMDCGGDICGGNPWSDRYCGVFEGDGVDSFDHRCLDCVRKLETSE